MRFFILASGYCADGSEFYFEPDPSTAVADAAKCSLCGNFYGMIPSLPPIKGTLVAAKAMFDLAANVGDEVVLSERALHGLQHNNILGLINPNRIELAAIEVVHRRNAVGEVEFFLAGVAQWGAEVDRVKSSLRTTETEVCPGCGYAGLIEGYDRVCILEDSWEGQDLFTIKGLPGVILASERVHALCIQLNLAVCGLVPAEQWKMPITNWPPVGNSFVSQN